MNPLLPVFLEEVRELIERGSDDLMALERQPAGGATLDSAFRAFHTLKGAAALFGFAPMTALLHAAEDVLGGAREGRVAVDQGLVDALLRCLDDVQSWLPSIEASETLPPDAAAQAARTQALLGPWRGEAGVAVHTAPLPEPGATTQDGAADDPLLAALLEAQAHLLRLDRPSVRASAARVAANACRGAGHTAAASRIETADPAGLADAVQAAMAATLPAPQAPEPAPAPAARVLRVAPERVERLVALAGEAVIARNALQHVLAGIGPGTDSADLAQAVKAPMAALERLVRDWHEAAMRLRMVPVAGIFTRFPRLVRDLARTLHRDVALHVSGEHLEADRDVLESLFEPLVHLVRNSLDHGIEDAATRRAAGKPATARLSLRAEAAAEALVIEVEDDGRGLDTAALRERAVARGLLGTDAAESLSEAAAAELIFLPGLSTAASVSAISGRGVGMDAVRSAVARAGGRVAVSSRRGEGLRVRLSLPMQVSVTRITTVFAGGTRFGVPLDRVSRILRVPQARVHALPAAGNDRRRAFALGEDILPLVRLADVLGLPPPPPAERLLVLVVEADSGMAGLEVDGLGDRADVILRPPTGLLAGTTGYLGTTLLGDGSVLLVLDVQALLP